MDFFFNDENSHELRYEDMPSLELGYRGFQHGKSLND